MHDNIVTYSGIVFSMTHPRTEDVRIEDIAHHLSMICRYTGAVRRFYSVAQHSCYVSHNCHPDHALEGLLHDATEAYITDISGPLKRTAYMSGYRELERIHYRNICNAFGLSYEFHPSVKEADTRMYYTETRDLMPQLDCTEHTDNNGIRYISSDADPYDFRIETRGPAVSEELFLRRFRELTQP